MANTVLIASITGIVVSGVVGPAATAWAARRAARKQFLRDQAAKRRDDLRAVLDEAAQLLGVGPIRLRETWEAQVTGAGLTEEQRAWPDQVFVIGERLQLRLGARDNVVTQYDAVRKALREAAQAAPQADRQRHENAVLRFEAARDDSWPQRRPSWISRSPRRSRGEPRQFPDHQRGGARHPPRGR